MNVEGRTMAYAPPATTVTTLQALIAIADGRLGSRHAVLNALQVSRQRLHDAMHGGSPLHAERLLRLGWAARVDPSVALRAGGRARFADLLERAYRPYGKADLAPRERALVRAFAGLPDAAQRGVLQLVVTFSKGSPPSGPVFGR